MLDRDAIKEYRGAAWRTRDELLSFVQRVQSVDAREVQKLLDVLVEHRGQVPAAQRNRCAALTALVRGSLDARMFLPLARALPDVDDVTREALAPLLVRANDTAQHEILCRHLGSSDAGLATVALKVLEQVAGPSALTHFVALVVQPDYRGRTEAMELMVDRARHHVIPLLSAVLEHGSTKERARALQHLVQAEVTEKGAEAAARAARIALSDRDPRVAGRACIAFAQLVDDVTFFNELEAEIFGPAPSAFIIQALGAYRSPEALAILEEMLSTGSGTVRLAVVDALERMAADEAIPLLVVAIQLDDPPVRRRATEVLAALSLGGLVDITRTIVELLRSGDASVRRIAAHLASSVPDAEGLADRLLGYLRDEDWWVRERVMDALMELDVPGLTQTAVRFLEDESPLMRRFAVGALTRLRDPGSLGAILRSAVNDEDWWVREQAVLATAELGDRRAVPYLTRLAYEHDELRLVALDALRLLRAEPELVELAALAESEEESVREAVVEYLAELDQGRRAERWVRRLADDRVPRIARKARDLLRAWAVEVPDAVQSEAVGLLDRLLISAIRAGADDLVLSAGRPPYVKRLGELEPLAERVVPEDELMEMLGPLLEPGQRARVRSGDDADFSYGVEAEGLRFRVNVFRQTTGTAAVFRHVHQEVPRFEALGLPPIVGRFTELSHGLVLVGGPTGSGKSTTLAALIDHINEHRPVHVVTLEDPIEVVHPLKRGLVNQRELGSHAEAVATSLRSILRQDPDVILVGELRDLETIDFAVNAAETGHLVFATVHTASADAAIDRLVHAFPGQRQPLVRSMLAESLRAVLCQQLLRRADRPGERVLACEVMINTEAVANLVRKDKCFQIPQVMATGRATGMQLLDDVLEQLVRAGHVDVDEALCKAAQKNSFAAMLEREGLIEAGSRDGGVEGRISAVDLGGGRASEPGPPPSGRPSQPGEPRFSRASNPYMTPVQPAERPVRGVARASRESVEPASPGPRERRRKPT